MGFGAIVPSGHNVGYSRDIFPLVLLRPYRNFLFWVRIRVKIKRLVTKPVTRR